MFPYTKQLYWGFAHVPSWKAPFWPESSGAKQNPPRAAASQTTCSLFTSNFRSSKVKVCSRMLSNITVTALPESAMADMADRPREKMAAGVPTPPKMWYVVSTDPHNYRLIWENQDLTYTLSDMYLISNISWTFTIFTDLIWQIFRHYHLDLDHLCQRQESTLQIYSPSPEIPRFAPWCWLKSYKVSPPVIAINRWYGT